MSQIEDLDKWSALTLMGWTMTYLTDTPSDLKIWVNKEGYNQSIIELWHPSDPATGQIWLCIEKIFKAKKWLLSLTKCEDGTWEVYFADWTKEHRCYESGDEIVGKIITDPNPAQAVLLAAKAALDLCGSSKLS